jgi:hypothetical protein
MSIMVLLSHSSQKLSYAVIAALEIPSDFGQF